MYYLDNLLKAMQVTGSVVDHGSYFGTPRDLSKIVRLIVMDEMVVLYRSATE
ncbi:hypothetical protein RCG17_11595 [Neobacillus sp. PS3-12]|uniref:hypothetical protein n=1 Tax=Neobacillus sp. PS3-12 TaxID=3070677 RepID=UPI0027E0D2D3|nr:hypothetical protein [Neobacillus sp. PS3-12]WML55168.1 hypothetical protein RCG17_11595 [Neobacillus sp. PS3-12]